MVIREENDNMILLESRASAIIYKFLVSLVRKPKKFILPVNICPIVSNVFKEASVQVEFLDIDPVDFCLDKKAALQLIRKEEISGILFNYSYGLNKDFSEFFKKIRSEVCRDFVIIEDRCLCNPDMPNASNDSLGDLILYSTGYSKYAEIGFGGYGILKEHQTISIEKYESMKGKLAINEKEVLCLNDISFSYKEYFAQLKNLKEKSCLHKKMINGIYVEHLSGKISVLSDQFNNWRYNILLNNKAEVINNIFKAGLFASSHYRPLEESAVKFPVASNLSKHVINLFNDFYFSENQAIAITKIINDSI